MGPTMFGTWLHLNDSVENSYQTSVRPEEFPKEIVIVTGKFPGIATGSLTTQRKVAKFSARKADYTEEGI